ncbi:MAG: winged helix-turn-helix domain-containing protein [Planctomycetes bacterium]|nr:winged helix-turn-helix domain-containing protein [Planctomycetota bacterium]
MTKTTKKRTKVKKAKAAGKAATKKPKAKKAETASKAATKKPEAKKAAGGQKPKRVSALDAAAQVLAKADKPMRAQELITAMAEQSLWASPAGKTPHATLYAAMLREIGAKGEAARFKKVDRGMFAFNKTGA